MENTVKALSEKIAQLQNQRYLVSMSDDFAYSNGTIDAIDLAIREVKMKLDRLGG